ncbi:hypothetical protein FNH74_17530 [Salmonella enterica subsp. houtenae]|nr:hypothetical protein [Salmonella enterica subsp. houtenae]
MFFKTSNPAALAAWDQYQFDQIVSRAIAFAVGKMAQQQGVAVKTSAEALQQAIDDNFWKPEYRDYRRTSI